MNQDELAIIKNYLNEIEKNKNSSVFLEPVDYVGLNILDYPQIIKHPMDLSTIRKKINENKYTTTEDIYKDIQLIWDNCKHYNVEGSDVFKMAIHCEKFTKRYFDKHIHQGGNSISNKKSSKNSNKNANSNQNNNSNNNTNNNANTNNNNEISEFNNNLKQEIPIDEYEQQPKPEDFAEEDKGVDIVNGLSSYEKVMLSNRVKKLQNDGLASLVRLVQKECPDSIKESDDNIEIFLASLDRKTYEDINRLIDTFLRVKETNQENLEQKKGKMI